MLKRLSFDLIGLAPTPDEYANFLADVSTNAYEKQVDRLLAIAGDISRWRAAAERLPAVAARANMRMPVILSSIAVPTPG